MSDRIRLADPIPEPAPAPAAEPEPPPQAPVESTPEREPEREPQAAPEPAEGDEPDGDGEPEGEAKPASADDARKIQNRLRAEVRAKHEAMREAAAAKALLEDLQRRQAQQQPGQPAGDAVEEAKRQLRAEQQQAAYNAACNKTFTAGKGEFPDFEDAVGALNAVGAGNRTDFLTAITAIPDGHRVYHALAQDLDNAARVLSLHPLQMAVELARMSVAQPAGNALAGNGTPEPPAVSNAPPPIRPLRGASRGPLPLDKVSMAEFIKQRDREEAERRGR